MADVSSEWRMANNEAFFRGANKQALDYIDELNDMADEGHDKEFLRYDDSPLLFHCECSDENCTERITIKPSRVSAVHENNRYFIVRPGHQTTNIERVIKRLKDYYIVEKIISPPKHTTHLEATDVNNT